MPRVRNLAVDSSAASKVRFHPHRSRADARGRRDGCTRTHTLPSATSRMRLDLSQRARLSHQMRLAPRMIQSMEILQMSTLALEERIEQELEGNVALERVEPGEDMQRLAEERADDAAEERLAEKPLVVQQDGSATADDFRRLSELESTYSDAFDPDNTWERPVVRDSGERDRKLDAMANTPSRGESLVEQLQHQWSFTDNPPEISAAGRILIDYIDDDGRLGADVETIMQQSAEEEDGHAREITLTREHFDRALDRVQHALDPPGIGARSVRECLLIQARLREAEHSTDQVWADVVRLLDRHFDDLLQNRLPKIERESGLSISRIETARERMSRLRMTPGRDVVDEDVPPVFPDVLIEFDETIDRYVARVPDGRVPALRISPRYERMAKDRRIDKSTRDFVANGVRSASWLIDAVGQRRATLLRVVQVVIDRQRDFFESGPLHLHPLPMIEVAAELGIHVGTVSRAVADKWVQTPRGLIPLRRFFSGGVGSRTGEDMSWEAVKQLVREIVESEDSAKPLSDQAIADALKERGVTIARRTVVKYREQLGIQPARRRKKHAGE